jgi:HEAT repeat
MESEEKRITAVELLTTLAGTFGADLCRRSIVPSASLLSADPSVDVRKCIALNLHKVYKAIRRDSLSRSRSRSIACASENDGADNGPSEKEASNMLISVVIRLSNDPEPLVRMASAESMVEISNAGGSSLADGPFLDPYSRLLEDPSETVRSVAMKQVGFFISSLTSSQIDEKLLRHYTDLVNDSLFPLGYDSELCYHCAYTFPGVFQAVGVHRWSELREVRITE